MLKTTKTDFYRKTVFSNISVTNLYLVSLYLQKSDQREIGLLNNYKNQLFTHH